ncbi:MAG TPA: FKBP-type peptidyl-prolyl cis-trans isomerase [Longimicrobium sp.]|nr:FKBP-type peptidyl-prolyl cis-trans isomerase [Longimicrobium sp.]
MRARYFVVFAALCAVAAACENDPIGPQCEEITSTVARTNGDTVTTTTGLRYRDVQAGTGPALQSCKAVSLRYIARLENGTVIDSLETGRSFSFVLGREGERSIPGFEEGLVGIRAGGERRLIVPAALAYGAEPQRDRNTGVVVIPANSTLIFDIRVLQVEAP